MQLIITKEKKYLELEDNIKIVANDFGVWFWENFFSVDAKIIDNNELDFNNYTRVYKDFEK
jgi:hypothetical protein